MSNTEKIIKYKTSINKIKASTLKELGFKSKTIAKNFAKLTNVNPKEYSNEELLLKALKNKLSMFQKLGLEFNFIKSFDYSSPKVKENRKKKQEKKYNETLEKLNKIENSFEQKFHIKIISDNNVDYFFKSEITEKSLEKTSDHYLKFRDFKMPVNKNYIPWEKTQHTRKKTVFLPFNYDIYKNDLTQFKSYLYQIYNDQKFTFKLTFEFSFLLVLSEDARIVSESEKKKNPELKKYKYKLMYNLFYPSTNTRLDSFENPVVVDNKNDIESIISKVKKEDLIEKVTRQVANNSAWKFYKFLGIAFHIYEMNTPIGKANELPIHFKQGSNEKALIKYENYDDYLCFWRCLAYHYERKEDPKKDPRKCERKLKSLYKEFYNKIDDIENYSGVQYVPYNTTDDIEDDNIDKKEDDIDKIEKHFKININIYTNDEPNIIQIDRRSINYYQDTLNLLRYNRHFMFIKKLEQMLHCYKCKNVVKYLIVKNNVIDMKINVMN